MTVVMGLVGVLMILWSVAVRGVPGSEKRTWRRGRSSDEQEFRGLPGVGAQHAPSAMRLGIGLVFLAAMVAYVDSH